jgi:AcrR family transcriptional regulator
MGIQERKEREKEHRKEEILDAAQKIFFKKGLITSTMDEIAESAELSKGTLYLYYKSKEDLYLGVMMRGMEILYEMCNRIAVSNGSVVLKMVGLIDAYKEFYRSNRSFFRMLNFFQTSEFHKQVSDETRQACTAQSGKLWKLMSTVLNKGMEEGTLRAGFNPIEITIIIWSSATALMLRNDGEGEGWRERTDIDLAHTLEVSNKLLLESLFTDRGRKEFALVAK